VVALKSGEKPRAAVPRIYPRQRRNQMGQTDKTNETIGGDEYFGICPHCHKNDGLHLPV
jgi:hypothetical protein